MGFDNIRFPTNISRGSSGGPERRTDIITTSSGREERNSRWANSKRRYNAGFGVKSLNDLQTVVAFFEERRGRLHAFRWKDHADFKSCPPNSTPVATDQVLGTGTGVQNQFQLVKNYGVGLRYYSRVVTAPVVGTVVVAVNGVSTTLFTTNVLTGVITFNAGAIPAAAAVVTAGFEFDVPVRFDSDELTINLTQFSAGAIPEIPLVEVLP
jgi:uncharacterized protein (TIGR02217 family)